MGKRRVIAETGAGQHGVATATMAAKFGLDCTIYMGEVDVARQRPNVFWMERLGATVVPVREGSRTLKDAINEAFRDWVNTMDTTHYVLGTACGPHPFPEMVTCFQSIVGKEAREQMLKIGTLPSRVYARVGGGSNAMGIFSDFFDDAEVALIDALALTVRKEGIIPALESSHAFAQAFKEAPDLPRDAVILINQSGRGDKDIFTIADAFEDPSWRNFIADKAE